MKTAKKRMNNIAFQTLVFMAIPIFGFFFIRDAWDKKDWVEGILGGSVLAGNRGNQNDLKDDQILLDDGRMSVWTLFNIITPVVWCFLMTFDRMMITGVCDIMSDHTQSLGRFLNVWTDLFSTSGLMMRYRRDQMMPNPELEKLLEALHCVEAAQEKCASAALSEVVVDENSSELADSGAESAHDNSTGSSHAGATGATRQRRRRIVNAGSSTTGAENTSDSTAVTISRSKAQKSLEISCKRLQLCTERSTRMGDPDWVFQVYEGYMKSRIKQAFIDHFANYYKEAPLKWMYETVNAVERKCERYRNMPADPNLWHFNAAEYWTQFGYHIFKKGVRNLISAHWEPMRNRLMIVKNLALIATVLNVIGVLLVVYPPDSGNASVHETSRAAKILIVSCFFVLTFSLNMIHFVAASKVASVTTAFIRAFPETKQEVFGDQKSEAAILNQRWMSMRRYMIENISFQWDPSNETADRLVTDTSQDPKAEGQFNPSLPLDSRPKEWLRQALTFTEEMKAIIALIATITATVLGIVNTSAN